MKGIEFIGRVRTLANITVNGKIIISRAWSFSNNGIPLPETTPARKLSTPLPKAGGHNFSLTVTAEHNVSASLEMSYYISVRPAAPGHGTLPLYPGWVAGFPRNFVERPVYRTAGQGSYGLRPGTHTQYFDCVKYGKIKLFSVMFIRSNSPIWNSIKIVIAANQDKIVKPGRPVLICIIKIQMIGITEVRDLNYRLWR